MAYIGNKLADSYTSFAKQDFTTSATTDYTLDYPVTNENEIALFINFVRQEPTTAYTATGTTLTLTSATSASDDMYCVFLGKALQTVNPPAGSVGTSQLASTAVTPAKMDLSQDYTFTGSVSGHMYPAFLATRASNQSIPNTTYTKVEFNTEVFDTDSCYDNSTNYRFTPTVAGKYFVSAQAGFQDFNNTNHRVIWSIYKNGSAYSTVGDLALSTNAGADPCMIINTTVDMNGSTDYLEVFVYQNSGGSVNIKDTSDYVKFQAFRIGS